MKEEVRKVLGAGILSAGVALAGCFVYMGIGKFADKDRCVTVKGLSEREVLANRVTWPMVIDLEGMDEDALYVELNAKKDTLMSLLKEKGISEDEMFASSPEINDLWAYEDNVKKRKTLRYGGSIDVTVTTRNVKLIMGLLNHQDELMKRGVKVSSNDYRIQYDYVDLSSLKPEMVEEATKDARKVAEKFAKDAECGLGSIMSATQGQFSIDEDYYRPQYKKIRVVTTVSYYLH